MIDLLPCPFCGGEAKIYKGVQFYWGSCMVCHAEGATKYTEAEAIEAWNTRAERMCNMRADGAHCMNGVEFYECCSCGEYACIPTVMGKSEPPNYCPNCGAKVVGE